MTNNMPKCYLDSNLLIYWDNKSSAKHHAASILIERLEKAETTLYISPLVLDEFLHAIILEARKVKSLDIYTTAMEALNNLLELPLLFIVNPPPDFDSQKAVVRLMQEYSLRPRDAYHLLTMQANKIHSFATFDSDFSKVFATKILNKV